MHCFHIYLSFDFFVCCNFRLLDGRWFLWMICFRFLKCCLSVSALCCLFSFLLFLWVSFFLEWENTGVDGQTTSWGCCQRLPKCQQCGGCVEIGPIEKDPTAGTNDPKSGLPLAQTQRKLRAWGMASTYEHLCCEMNMFFPGLFGDTSTDTVYFRCSQSGPVMLAALW